jgi:hypothetical protein
LNFEPNTLTFGLFSRVTDKNRKNAHFYLKICQNRQNRQTLVSGNAIVVIGNATVVNGNASVVNGNASVVRGNGEIGKGNQG